MMLPENDDELILSAYLDGELDAAAALTIERRLGAESPLQADYERLAALRSTIGAAIPKNVASQAFRRKIAALAVAPPLAVDARARTFDWRQMAASVLIAAVFGSGGTLFALRQDLGAGDLDSIIAEHRRALLAASPVDVESTDRHTVKPWFDAKLALSPQVIDLAQAGFPLAGGRVEVVGGKLVPALVYRRREHIVSLVAVPRPGVRGDAMPLSSATEDGYLVLGWHGQDFDYFAVSDIATNELEGFVSQWRAAAK